MQVNICSRLIEKKTKCGVEYVHMSDNYYPLKLKILSERIPLGLYAKQCYKSNEIVYEMTGKLINKPTPTSIHIGDNMHLEDEFGQYINHSFDPNIKVVGNKLIAIQDIDMYDEITFNYNESELGMASTFEDEGVIVCGKKKN